MKKLFFLFVILTAGFSLFALGSKEDKVPQTPVEYSIEESFSELEFNWNYGNIKITDSDDSCTISTPSKTFSYTVENGKLCIKGSGDTSYDITLCIPEKLNLKKADISSGVGKVELDNLKTEVLVFRLNVGDVNCTFGTMPATVDFKSGTGDVNITFPGTEAIEIEAPYGLGGRDFAERFSDVKGSAIRIEVSVGNTSIR